MAKVGSYLYLSEKDAVRAKQMFSLEDYTACGRFCEQSVEKSLKAYLERMGNVNDLRLMSLHKPKRIYERCCELGLEPQDKQLALVLAVFSEYYYDTNYPGSAYFELTREQAEEALAIMQRVNKTVASQLPDEIGKMDVFGET